MTRREFITGIGGAVVWPLAGHAQQIDRIRRIAIVSPAVPVGEMTIEARYAALFNELRKLGYVEGRNLIVERYSAVGRPERYGDLARDYEQRTRILILSSPTATPSFAVCKRRRIPSPLLLRWPIPSHLDRWLVWRGRARI